MNPYAVTPSMRLSAAASASLAAYTGSLPSLRTLVISAPTMSWTRRSFGVQTCNRYHVIDASH
ncbi:MAG: hypothetical protein RLZZ387_2348 [Chloroflexota bacterium]